MVVAEGWGREPGLKQSSGLFVPGERPGLAPGMSVVEYPPA
jgi:hypothetical protein